ncbi:MAG: hypothetical protein HY316_05420, partial [Acidobacteria bacterium]|nr:hypothetical protein [Acidobacteriota bacterium]
MHQRSNRSHRRWITALAMISLGWWMRAAMPASAQTINFVASTDASVVANTGLSEVVGDLFLVAGSACGNSDDKACLSSEATIQVRLPNVIIDNSTATGLRVCESFGTPCNEPGTLLTGSITVTADTILIRIREGIDLAASDRITIAGIRARIASSVLRTPGTEATAVVTATPASAATISTDPLILARSARPLLLQVTSVPEIPCSVQDAIPTLLVTEGYRTAFVDYGDAAGRSYPGQPLLPRNPLGGNANTRVRLAVSGVVAAVKIQWPLTIPAQNSTAALDLLSQSADGTTATYIYETPNQLQGDQLSEIFAVRLYPVNFNFSGSEALTGIVTAQGQLLPPPSPEDIRPRFDHPLEPDPGLPYFLLKRCTVPQTATGTAQVRAMVGNFPWSGTLNYRLEGPALFSGTQASESITGVPIGTYAAIHLSGGPAGATFSNITPSNAQALSPGGTIDYTFNFTGPTIANLQLMSNPLPVCVSSSTPVGSFHLSNATGDVQIIPAGTALAFTFSNIIDTLPTATGLGSAVVSSSAVTVQYQLPGGLRLPPGGVVTFSGTRLNLNGVANGQNITVLLTSIPPAALQLATNQAVVATASAAACLPVVNLSVSPASIQLGQSATLQWTSQNATELDLQPGVGSVPLQGSLTVSPTSTTTYTMTARGPQGT